MTKPLYFYNGSSFEQVGPTVPQSPIAYQTSAPTGPATGDLWIDSDGDVDTYTRQLTRYKFVASGGETSLSGPDANNVTLAYTAGSEMVYLNGALLNRGSDYVATNGTSITSLAALSLNDIVEVFAYVAFNPANTYTKSEADGLFANGLQLVVPTSVTVGSGSGSVSSAGAVTFSGASSVSINGCFTSNYDNYRVVLNNGTNSNTANITFRFRTTSDDSTSNYYMQRNIVNQSGTASASSDNGTTSYTLSSNTSGASLVAHSMDIISPYLSNNTFIYGSGFSDVGGSYGTRFYGAQFNASTSFTGFSLINSSGNFSGTLRIYGYRNG